MVPEKNLKALLSNMQPRLSEREFVFCTLEEEKLEGLGTHPIAIFRESEAVSVVIPRRIADDMGLRYGFIARMINLGVHSSLEAVGFLAAISGELARVGISVNPVSAYYHDYLFVPSERSEEALAVLEEMIRTAT